MADRYKWPMLNNFLSPPTRLTNPPKWAPFGHSRRGLRHLQQAGRLSFGGELARALDFPVQFLARVQRANPVIAISR